MKFVKHAHVALKTGTAPVLLDVLESEHQVGENLLELIKEYVWGLAIHYMSVLHQQVELSINEHEKAKVAYVEPSIALSSSSLKN